MRFEVGVSRNSSLSLPNIIKCNIADLFVKFHNVKGNFLNTFKYTLIFSPVALLIVNSLEENIKYNYFVSLFLFHIIKLISNS